MAAGAVQLEGYGDPCPGGACAVPGARPTWQAGVGIQSTVDAMAGFRALEARLAAEDAAAALSGARVAAQLGPVYPASEVRGTMTFDPTVAQAVFGGIADVFRAKSSADVAREQARAEAARVAVARPLPFAGLSLGGLVAPALLVVGVLAALRMVTRR